MIVDKLQKIMSEKKTRLPSLKNQDWKRVTEVNELLIHISTKSIMELNEFIYAGTNCDEISVPLKNLNRISDPEWGIRLETLLKNLRQQEKKIIHR